ncbi:hypothetical protein F4604DRAFT_1970201 [Suillus subluteus]|nr:hypothetical protein F4604DRAFT_1934371 [Suillus subluteus]KAG1850691.1 hypothetical protein F4604DRAFT_1970201 [Suillus subluteus]
MYEIGCVFWNEGIDLTHNPEFTLCKFYMAHMDMYDLMEVRGNLLEGMAKYLNGGSTIVKYPEGTAKYLNSSSMIVKYPEGKDRKELMLDFKMVWKRYDMIETVEKKTGAQHQHWISGLLEW